MSDINDCIDNNVTGNAYCSDPTSTSYSYISSGHSIVSNNTSMKFSFDCIKVSENIVLENRSDNFIIFNQGKSLITWCNNSSNWVQHEIKVFKRRFIKSLSKKELSESDSEKDSVNCDFVSIIISQEGNYYLDLKNKSYYVFKDNFWNSLDLVGELRLEIEREIKINSLKDNEKNSKLLLEIIPKLKLGIKGDTFMETGFIYAPYISLEICEELNESESFSVNKKVKSRYSTSSVSSSFYSTVNIAQ